jgi:hypothetical protein
LNGAPPPSCCQPRRNAPCNAPWAHTLKFARRTPPRPGTVKQTLAFDAAAEGVPVLLDASGDHLAVATSAGMVRLFRLTGREVRPHAGPGEAGRLSG